jgi:hypothetical protein
VGEKTHIRKSATPNKMPEKCVEMGVIRETRDHFSCDTNVYHNSKHQIPIFYDMLSEYDLGYRTHKRAISG